MIRHDKFETRFSKIIKFWGTEAFPEPYRERAMIRTNDMSTEEIDQLGVFLMEHCQRTPTLAQLVAISASIKNQRQDFRPNTPIKSIDCITCNDMGVMAVSGDGAKDELMRCQEKCRTSTYWSLPRFRHNFGLTAKKVPSEWFGKQGQNKNEVIHDWMMKIKLSQSFWREKCYELEVL